jgi:hypothetical protein
MDYEPLTAINDAFLNKLIPREIYEIILKRFSILLDGIKRIEKTSMIKFPPYSIEPSLVVSSSLIEVDQYGLLFARTIQILIIREIYLYLFRLLLLLSSMD